MPHHDEIHLEQEVVFQRKLAEFSKHDMHTHDALEISILLENEAIYHLSHNDYIGRPGDVFIFRPFEPHWTLVKEETKPVKWIMILFTPAVVRLVPDGFKMLAPFYAIDLFNPLISTKQPNTKQIHDATMLAVQEGDDKLPGWQARQYVQLISILILIYRCYLDTLESTDSKLEPGIIHSIEYILRNFQYVIDSDDLIAVSGLKKTLFYHKFQESTQLTPNDFINKLRLQHAVHLLKFSSKSVTEIAFESGFNSISYFNRAFKQSKGISPSLFRLAQV